MKCDNTDTSLCQKFCFPLAHCMRRKNLLENEKMKKGKCEICNKKINPGNKRCDQCHTAWLAGFTTGQKAIKNKLRETIEAFLFGFS